MIDISKLGKGTRQGNKTVYPCIACQTDGGDSKGNHLALFDTGAFSCIKFPSDKNHNKKILELAGTNENLLRDVTDVISQPISQEKIYDKSILLKLLPIYDYWATRGISKEVQKHFEIGIAMSGSLRMRVVTPIYNESNQIIGFSGRLIKDNPNKHKYHHHGRKSNWLWPLHLNKQIILDKKEVILCEGAGDIFSLFQSGIENCLCCFGKTIPTKLLNKIIALNPQKVILAFNADKAGKDACNQATEQLNSFFSEDKVICKLPPTKDLNDLLMEKGIDGVKEWYQS